MKFCWRITKYNPEYREPSGIFLKDEWTDYSDIGKIFNSQTLTYAEYVYIENLYIQAILCFMNCHDIKTLQVTTLEKQKKIKSDAHNTHAMIKLFNTIQEKDWLTEDNIENLCKLILRNKLWCKLRYSRKMFVHFGWDFYMYIGSSLSCNNAISIIQKSGLFVEPFESPYQT